MDKVSTMALYVDSAMAFFNDKDRIDQYPDIYLKVLLTKGNQSFLANSYDEALDYYYKAKKLLLTTGCDDGDLDSKMATIYYKQKNYRLAAQYLVEEYKLTGNCAQKQTIQQVFFLKQSALDNAGFAYEKAGMLDSAAYYFKLDLDYINDMTNKHVMVEQSVASARFVVYDNLGGLNMLKGDYAKAMEYLNKCLAIPYNDADGLRITPFLKLAEIYYKTGQYAKADSAFKKSRELLNRFYKDNAEQDIKWNMLYAEYMFKKQQPVKAYNYQQNFIRLKDSFDNAAIKINQLNVDRELNTIQQRQTLIELKRQDSIKQLYIVCITFAVAMAVVIIVLINRNLKQSRKNHKLAALQNEQLQTTLAELERANKNYIRIMRVMAHDLRNPLSGMIGLATVLLDEDEFSEDSKHMLQLIETTGVHSIEMINELLKSGLADENEVIAKQNLDLKALLQDSVELLQFKANEKDQQIIFEADEMPVMTDVNHEKIWRVFNNLIVNAIKFSYEGGTIKAGIKVTNDNKHILVHVADNGMGIPDKDKDSIFEMFTPAKKTGTNGEQPFGLGLSISKKIIEKHNGRIWFESTPGTGTVFYIELPK